MTTPDAESLPVPRVVVGVPTGASAAAGATGARERTREPAWVRLAPLGLGLLAAVLYLWNLDVSGYANTYYSAAAQAAGQSLSAWFFGSLDAASFITVDKPPLSVWLMGLSVRLFGLSPMSVLLPQAVAGVASVVLLYVTVKRQLGPLAGLIAGAAFALTPVAVLMFRYNNPDAVLTLLLVAAAWALVRGLEHGRIRWAVLASVLVGFAFLTKFLQAYLVLPAFAVTWLVAAPGSVRRRVAGLVASGAAVAVSSLWWVAAVEAIPAASRPFIGGSPTNSVVQLLLGYDGIGRIVGGEGGPNTGGPGGGGAFGGGAFGGSPGVLRMFNEEWASHVSWLLPGAAIGLVTGLIARARPGRTDVRRAAFVLWGTWALVHVLVFSFMSGIAHPYYAVALAPATAALFGGGVAELWRARAKVRWAGVVIGGMLVLTAAWAWILLGRTPDFFPGAGMWALVITVAAAVVLAVAVAIGRGPTMLPRAALVVGVAAVLVGPVLYAGATMSRAIAGGDPAPGPADGRFAGRLGGGFGGFGGPDGSAASAEVVDYLVANRGEATWLVAATSAGEAAPIQLQTGVPVMAMGGFSGSDPAPTLEELQGYLRDGSLRFVLVRGIGGGPGMNVGGGVGRFGEGGQRPADGPDDVGGAGGRGSGPVGGPDAGPAGFGAPGGFGGFGGFGGGEVARERTEWVMESCAPVSIGGQQTGLFDCAGAGD